MGRGRIGGPVTDDRLRERIGTGGMGEVYLAEHELLKRPCAVKLIRPEFDDPADITFDLGCQRSRRIDLPDIHRMLAAKRGNEAAQRNLARLGNR